MWVQHHPGGPLARVVAGDHTADGGANRTVWVVAGSGEHRLVACTPPAAWCIGPPPEPETVASACAEPRRALDSDVLVRVDADGAVRHVRTDRPVTWVQADADALHVRVLDSS